jgi:hypothetical protein
MSRLHLPTQSDDASSHHLQATVSDSNCTAYGKKCMAPLCVHKVVDTIQYAAGGPRPAALQLHSCSKTAARHCEHYCSQMAGPATFVHAQCSCNQHAAYWQGASGCQLIRGTVLHKGTTTAQVLASTSPHVQQSWCTCCRDNFAAMAVLLIKPLEQRYWYCNN